MQTQLLETGIAVQRRTRGASLMTLSRLRREAAAEIERLLAFLDASDPYVMTEREEGADDGPCDTDELEVGEGDEEDGGDREPSLGSIERHPSCYGADGRNWTGDQTLWGASASLDLEDEHDGAEPGEDEEPWLGWSTSGVLGTCATDRERDDCDREASEPLLTDCT